MNLTICYILLFLMVIYFFNKFVKESFAINEAIIPIELYPELKEIENNKAIIMKELYNIIDKKVWILYESLHKEKIIEKDYNNEEINKLDLTINKYFVNSTNKPEWYVFWLIYNNNPITSSLQYFPQTIKILQKNKNITMAGISCLEAGKYIPPHNDEGFERYKYHLPLIIPKNCGIKINSVEYTFDKPFLFDDTFTHSVWNYSNDSRYVLIIDVTKHKYRL